MDGFPPKDSSLSRVDEFPLEDRSEVDELPSDSVSESEGTLIRKDVLTDGSGVLGFWVLGCLNLDKLAVVVQLDLLLRLRSQPSIKDQEFVKSKT